jgi:hypothetical protein
MKKIICLALFAALLFSACGRGIGPFRPASPPPKSGDQSAGQSAEQSTEQPDTVFTPEQLATVDERRMSKLVVLTVYFCGDDMPDALENIPKAAGTHGGSAYFMLCGAFFDTSKPVSTAAFTEFSVATYGVDAMQTESAKQAAEDSRSGEGFIDGSYFIFGIEMGPYVDNAVMGISPNGSITYTYDQFDRKWSQAPDGGEVEESILVGNYTLNLQLVEVNGNLYTHIVGCDKNF